MEDIFGGLVLLMGGFVSIFAIIALSLIHISEPTRRS